VALLEKLEIVIDADAREAKREFEKIGRDAEQSLSSIAVAAGEVGGDAADRLAGSAGEFRKAGEKLSDAAGDSLDMSAAAQEAAADVSRALEREKGNAEQAGRRVGASAMDGVSDGVRSNTSGFDKLGADIGQETGGGIGGGIMEGLGGLSGGLSSVMDDALGALPEGVAAPAAAAAAVVGAMFVQGFADAVANDAAIDILGNRLSTLGANQEQLATVSANLFRDAWGESTAEVNDAIDAVYSTLSESRESEEALESLTGMAMGLAAVLGVDVTEAVQAAGTLISTGLATDAVNAFDQITTAAESVPKAMRDEILTVFTEGEYAAAFEALGFSGEQAFGTLVEAAQQGTFQLDKTGDAVTEFTRLNQDMTEGLKGAYDIIGLGAEEYQAKILQGGPVARQAFLEIIEAILQVESPAQRATAALGLFGTPLGDIASDTEQLNEVLGFMAANALPGVAGSANDNAEAFDNMDASITTVKRSLQTLFSDYANETLDPLANLIQEDDKSIGDYAAAAGQTFLDVFETTITGPLGYIINKALPGDMTIQGAIGGVLGDAWNFVFGGDEPQVEGDFNAISGWFGVIGVEAQGAGAKIAETGGGLKSFGGLVDNVAKEMQHASDMFDLAGFRATAFQEKLDDTTGLDNMLSSTLALNDSLPDLFEALSSLGNNFDVSDIASGIETAGDDVAGYLSQIAGVGSSVQQVIADTLEYQGEGAAVDRADDLRASFVGMMEDASFTEEQIRELLEVIGLSDWQIEASITLSGNEEAFRKLQVLRSYLEDADGNSILPEELNAQIGIEIQEGDFASAVDWIRIWQEDIQDGFIDNPWLVSMGLGPTRPVEDGVQALKDGETAKPPMRLPVGVNTELATGDLSLWKIFASAGITNTPVGADTNPATTTTNVWKDSVRGAPSTDIPIGANLDPARVALSNFFNQMPVFRIPIAAAGGFNPPRPTIRGPGRATGGRVIEGAGYTVNEFAPEAFMPDSPGFVMSAADTKALVDGVRALVTAGGGQGMVVNQNIVTADPMVSASESVRRMRDARYLAGAR